MSATPEAVTSADRLAGDFGWGLAVLFRGYVKAADAVTEGLPGGHRGYQVLSAAARDEPGSQAALAARLGIDRTVMTYLLDDLVAAGLVERRQDPSDRRTRLVVATKHGRVVLADLEARFALAEQHIMAGLSAADQETFRGLLAVLARHVNDPDPVATACDAVAEIGRRTSG
ncbi:MAG TPA: MarR family transcriptional regulator [Trebonia sp.]|jgi:DNA-binding MarR family transcriptional regulator|nr:MarR family transcriptional regulator [Trebonia sp.]